MQLEIDFEYQGWLFLYLQKMMLLTYLSIALAIIVMQVDSQTSINSTVLTDATEAIEVFSSI